MLNHALRYAQTLGPVLPKHGKVPLKGSHGAQDATTDLEQIRKWFEGRRDLNVAIRTDNLAVLDVDAKPEGFRWLAEHRRQLHNLTLTDRSGGGGWHFWFQLPQHIDLVGVVSKGVDLLRGPGQSVTAPPSIHPLTGARYEWIKTFPRTPQTMPPWLIGLCTRPVMPVRLRTEPREADHETQLERARKYALRVEGAIDGSGGHRHTYTFLLKLAGNFPALDFEDLWGILTEWNSTCLPPWNQKDLLHKLQDAMKRTRAGVAA
jgi:hypothetical protein